MVGKRSFDSGLTCPHRRRNAPPLPLSQWSVCINGLSACSASSVSIRLAEHLCDEALAGWTRTDADGWERESYGEWYFEEFSTKSYRLGINIVIYALSH